jgi:hypothetical protein
MVLKGSCHCGAVRFAVQSHTPYPYMCCYCSICRKTAGGGGYAINIMGAAKSLKVEGRRNLSVYRAKVSPRAKKPSPGRRHFCRRCGSALWVWDPRWPDWIYPFASAIDTPLPKPKERQHIFLSSKAPWVEVPGGPREKRFREFPKEAIVDWHRRRGLLR